MTTTNGTISRSIAALTAAAAWVGLGTQLVASYDLTGSMSESLWVMIRYFTVITNLIVAAVFTGVALEIRPASPPVVGGVILAILLVGVVYGLLLRGLVELSGGALAADWLLHKATPVLALAYWIPFAPKGHLRQIHPPLWTIFPLLYFVYALIRGKLDGHYPYPFMDAGQIGWPATAANGAFIAAGFLLAGSALVWVDGQIAARRVSA
ncbi:MAG: Pr6Pr family membrane protein [Sphingosinicella sp.]|nr:Pr6Pr family membrane protein [Sphingosinicella sp.]